MSLTEAEKAERRALESINLDALALKRKNPMLTMQQCQAQALANNPELYTAYLEAHREVAKGTR